MIANVKLEATKIVLILSCFSPEDNLLNHSLLSISQFFILTLCTSLVFAQYGGGGGDSSYEDQKDEGFGGNDYGGGDSQQKESGYGSSGM